MKHSNFSHFKRGIIFLSLLALAPAAQPIIDRDFRAQSGNPPSHVVHRGTPEEMIIAAIDAIRQGKSREALATVDRLLVLEPNYRLAHLLRADLYAMRAMPLATMGGGINGPADRLEDLRREALVRIQHRISPPPAQALPANLLRFSSQQKYAVLVDTSVARLYLFENQNGIPKLVTDSYVTIGKLGASKQSEGDQRTPLGVYFVNGKLTRDQLDKTYGSQADLYGVGAWPISYPNEWDKREKRTGHGIWLHGSPANTYARPPQASNGCVVLTNTEMEQIASHLQVGITPVIITQSIDWISSTEWEKQRNQIQNQIDQWRTAWESLQTTHYLAFYGRDFQSAEGLDIAAWKQQKTAINARKQWTKIKLDEISIFSTGGNQPLLVSSFSQDYKSDNLANQSNKRLYWKQEGSQWRIVWEGTTKNGV